VEFIHPPKTEFRKPAPVYKAKAVDPEKMGISGAFCPSKTGQYCGCESPLSQPPLNFYPVKYIRAA
jgi:hypothetical protein